MVETTLVQAAWAGCRKKGAYLRAQYLATQGAPRPDEGLVAVAASILTAAYHMLKRNTPYQDLTGAYFDSRDRTRLANRLVRRLGDLGVRVQITSPAPEPAVSA